MKDITSDSSMSRPSHESICSTYIFVARAKNLITFRILLQRVKKVMQKKISLASKSPKNSVGMTVVHNFGSKTGRKFAFLKAWSLLYKSKVIYKCTTMPFVSLLTTFLLTKSLMPCSIGRAYLFNVKSFLHQPTFIHLMHFVKLPKRIVHGHFSYFLRSQSTHGYILGIGLCGWWGIHHVSWILNAFIQSPIYLNTSLMVSSRICLVVGKVLGFI